MILEAAFTVALLEVLLYKESYHLTLWENTNWFYGKIIQFYTMGKYHLKLLQDNTLSQYRKISSDIRKMPSKTMGKYHLTLWENTIWHYGKIPSDTGKIPCDTMGKYHLTLWENTISHNWKKDIRKMPWKYHLTLWENTIWRFGNMNLNLPSDTRWTLMKIAIVEWISTPT